MAHDTQYDVIVVGTRLAGAATALLLARQGLRVLGVDRATFPSDTLSSHQLQQPGVACLARWGLLDRLVAAGVPPTRRVRFDSGPAVIRGELGKVDGVDAMFSPRRTVLDTLLVDAARESGAELVEGFDVTDLVSCEGTVTGIRGRERGSGGRERTYAARLVVGADGKGSQVAKAVAASTYRETAPLAAAFYAYWDGLPTDGGEMYTRDRRVIGAWPTQDGLVVTFVGLPADDFGAFRRDPAGSVLEALDGAGDLGQRARSAAVVGPVRGTDDLPNRFRVPSGRGWALVGDAGLVMDPITGQGMGHALMDAEQLATAVVDGLGGGQPLERSMRAYHRQRDEARRPMFELTTQLASFRPRGGSDVLFRALADNPEQGARFLRVLGGIDSPREFFGLRNMRQLVGWRGLATLARSKPA